MTSSTKKQLAEIFDIDKLPLNPGEFSNAMNKIGEKYEGDEELCHVVMDALMMSQLSALGYDEGVWVFDCTPRWYA